MAVGFGRIVPEPLEHIDADLLLFGKDRMRLEGRDQFVAADRHAPVADVDVPGLVVDAGAHDIDIVHLRPQRGRDLAVAVLHAMAQAHRLHPAMFQRRPGQHGHRVGIVEEPGALLRLFADVAAEIENGRNAALAVHDAARADRIAHALVDAVFERNADVVGKRLQPADAHATDHIARAIKRRAPVGGGGDLGVQAVDLDRAPQDLRDHVEVVRIDIGQRDLDVVELGHLPDVGAQFACEANASGADDGDLEVGHGCASSCRALRNCRCGRHWRAARRYSPTSASWVWRALARALGSAAMADFAALRSSRPSPSSTGV